MRASYSAASHRAPSTTTSATALGARPGQADAHLVILVGIFKALHILHGDYLADRWVGMSNRNRIFGGRSPLDHMLQGGAPAMQTVRRLLDARRGGA